MAVFLDLENIALGARDANYPNFEVDKVLERLRHIPGVEHAAAVNGFPLDRGLNILIPPKDKQDKMYIVELRLVTPDYFKTVGIPLLAGRDVQESDKEDSPPVIIVSQAMAKLGNFDGLSQFI